MAVRPRNILSLCAGVGGLELGIQLALRHRMETARGICYVEREAAAAASLVASMEAGWFHPAPVWSDMLTFDAKPWRGVVDILASGDPCQDNSVAGKGAGASGKRFLAPEVVRIAGECRPDLIVRENVPGNTGGQLDAIVPALERLGYRVASGIWSSAGTGNTMRRERLFIVAERDGSGAAGEQISLTERGGTADIGYCDRQLARAAGERRGKARADSDRPKEWLGRSRRELGGPECSGDGRDALDEGRGSIRRTAVDRTGRAGGRNVVSPESDGRGGRVARTNGGARAIFPCRGRR